MEYIWPYMSFKYNFTDKKTCLTKHITCHQTTISQLPIKINLKPSEFPLLFTLGGLSNPAPDWPYDKNIYK